MWVERMKWVIYCTKMKQCERWKKSCHCSVVRMFYILKWWQLMRHFTCCYIGLGWDRMKLSICLHSVMILPWGLELHFWPVIFIDLMVWIFDSVSNTWFLWFLLRWAQLCCCLAPSGAIFLSFYLLFFFFFFLNSELMALSRVKLLSFFLPGHKETTERNFFYLVFQPVWWPLSGLHLPSYAWWKGLFPVAVLFTVRQKLQ